MNAFSFDFTKDKSKISEPIPGGTKLLLRMTYTPGGVGPNNALTQSKETDAQYLKAEFTVLRGPYKGRKFWENMTFAGGKLDEKGNSIAATISRGTIRAIIDASEGLSSKDESPAACAKRVLANGFTDLQARVFAAKVAVEPAKGNYAAKNKLGTVLTLDHKDYPKDQTELDTMGPTTAQAPAGLPAPATPAWTGTTEGVTRANAAAPAAPAFVAPAAPTTPAAPPAPQALAPAPALPAPMPQGQAPAAEGNVLTAPVATAAADASPVPAWMRA